MRRPDVDSLRAAWWTLRSIRSVRRQLRDGQLEDVVVPPVPPLPYAASRGIAAVVRRSRAPCLTTATVRQAWFAAHGVHRDLVIGVTPPSDGFKAHAWLDGDPESGRAEYRELSRRPAT